MIAILFITRGARSGGSSFRDWRRVYNGAASAGWCESAAGRKNRLKKPALHLFALASFLAASMAPAVQAFEGTPGAARATTDVHARASAGLRAGAHPIASKKKPAPAARHAAPADGPPPPPLDNPALHRDQPVRVGLSANRERVVLSCAGPFRVTDPATGQAAWKESYGQPLMVGVRGAPPTEGRIYRAQTGSFEKKEAAEELAARLRTELGEPVVVAWVPDRKVWRVRVGAADSREGLAGVMAKLRAAGHADAWINDEPVPQEGESSLVLVDANYDTKVAPTKALLVEPAASGSLLSVDGKTYRGSLEVRIDLSGGIRVVNILPVESYLRGVVPAELGPGVYPELEALKAQAVAARTYVYRNLGQFAEEGFDLCDTPRCQVYEGVKVEHPLSDRAIRETEGEIETWLGTPINALYTSTCGGHTEDAIEIFPEDAAPYLTGVPCGPEQRSHRARRILLAGDPALADASGPAAEAAALLAVHGLIPRGALGAGPLAQTIPTAEAESWIESMRTPAASSRRRAPAARGERVKAGWGEPGGRGIERERFEEQPQG